MADLTTTQGQLDALAGAKQTLLGMQAQLSSTPASTINSSVLQPQTPINVPPPATPDASNLNASITSPVSAQSIISQANAPTATDSNQKNILDRIAALTGSQQGQTTLTNQAEQAAGVPDLAKKVNDYTAQLEGLNNQAAALQNEAQYTIPNQAQQDAQGRGITAGGLAPITTAQLRNNQIKQGAIATQALTVKSLVYAAQGNLTLAKDAADKAATAQFEQQQINLDAQKAQLAAIQPTLDREQQARAATLQAQLADRQKQLDYARADKSTIISWAAAALANGASALQADQISKANDLDSAFKLYAPFATDPNATQKAVLDLQAQRLNIQKTQQENDLAAAKNPIELAQAKANLAKTNADIAKVNADIAAGSGDKVQQKLETDYKNTLLKEVSNRSGGLGLQDQKVNQAIHLKALIDQNTTTDANGATHYNLTPQQYNELAMGLASLLSNTNTVSDSARQEINAKTAKGDVAGALQYITGAPQQGNTDAIIQNLKDSIDRQGEVAQQLRDQAVQFLHGLAPTDLNPDRIAALEKNTLASYTKPLSQQVKEAVAAGHPAGDIINYLLTKGDADTQAKVLEAQKQGYSPEDILNYIQNQK